MLNELGYTLEVTSKAKTALTVSRLSKRSTKTTEILQHECMNNCAVLEGPISKVNLQFLPRETAFHQDYRKIR